MILTKRTVFFIHSESECRRIDVSKTERARTNTPERRFFKKYELLLLQLESDKWDFSCLFSSFFAWFMAALSSVVSRSAPSCIVLQNGIKLCDTTNFVDETRTKWNSAAILNFTSWFVFFSSILRHNNWYKASKMEPNCNWNDRLVNWSDAPIDTFFHRLRHNSNNVPIFAIWISRKTSFSFWFYFIWMAFVLFLLLVKFQFLNEKYTEEGCV